MTSGLTERLNDFLCPCCGAGADIIRPALLIAFHRAEDDYGKRLTVTSGYRCARHNAAIGGSPDSAHTEGMAVDVADEDAALLAWMTEDMLAIYGLWQEAGTKGWRHWQIRPAKHRIFLP